MTAEFRVLRLETDEALTQRTLFTFASFEIFDRWVETHADQRRVPLLRYADLDNEAPFELDLGEDVRDVRKIVNFVIVRDPQSPDRRYWFGAITATEQLTPTVIRIHWTMDHWLSSLYRRAEQGEESPSGFVRNLHVDRFFIERRPRTALGDMFGVPVQPYAPRTMTVTHKFPIGGDYAAPTMVWVIKQLRSGSDVLQGPIYCFINTVGEEALASDFIEQWDEFTAADVTGAWLVPNYIAAPDPFPPFHLSKEGKKGKRFIWTYQPTAIYQMSRIHQELSGRIPLDPDEMHKVVFTDAGGSVVYDLQRFRRIRWADVSVLISASTCQLEVVLSEEETQVSMSPDFVRARSQGDTFTIAAAPLDVIIDHWEEYSARSRQFEQEMRSLQNRKQLEEGRLGAVSSALGGGIGGAMTGNPVGAAAGAVLGGVSSLLTSQIGFELNKGYNSRIQSLTDMSFRLAQDELILAGNSMVHLLLSPTIWVVRLEADVQSRMRMDWDIQGNGIHVSEYIEGDDWMFAMDGPLKADVMISGRIPLDDKRRIEQRFADGVLVRRISEV